ncbi:antitoxin [Psychromicrobium lacuslunae]|uniref:antitoxin n=1 Tax=Psychromicrobium lacuslunae TaxID=1618207 RepID=UPI000696B85B|nr:antitoxin [Psychromicrobium lacuslunae]
MSIFDDIKGKAEDLIGDNADKLKDGIEKVGDFIDDKTGDKFKDQIDGAQKAASDFVDNANKDDAPAADPQA